MFCFKKREFGVVVRFSPHIMRCILDWWEDLMEYMVRVTGNFDGQTFIKRRSIMFLCGWQGYLSRINLLSEHSNCLMRSRLANPYFGRTAYVK